MLLDTLGASLLENLLTGRGVKTTTQVRGINWPGKGRGGEGGLREGYGSRSYKMDF